MKRCKATNKDGTPCRNIALQGGDYCHVHKSQIMGSAPALAIGGALLGNLIVPGVGGALVGAFIGGLIGASASKGSKDE